MKYLLYQFIFLASFLSGYSQDVRVYHGDISETVYLKQHDKLENSSREKIKMVRAVNGIVTINIINPNPFYYNYEIKTEDLEIKDDYSDQFGELLKVINGLPDLNKVETNPFTGSTSGASRSTPPTAFDHYKTLIEGLSRDLADAKKFIENSDHPETVEEAFKRIGNPSGYGFRSAIASIERLNSTSGRFNSKSLPKDLDEALTASFTDASFAVSLGIDSNAALIVLFKSAFTELNKQLSGAVKKIRDITTKDKILRFQIPVKDNKQTNVKLIITKINSEETTVRELINEDMITVLPYYTRKRFEVVPVINVTFQSNRKIFSVENNVIQSNSDDDANFSIGAMALMNIASFGEFKEYGVGLGIGYSLQPNAKTNSLFVLPSISYRDVIRIGFGFGYNRAPIGLKNGVNVGDPLPSDISNIEDIIDYKRKPAAVLSIAIAGFKF